LPPFLSIFQAIPLDEQNPDYPALARRVRELIDGAAAEAAHPAFDPTVCPFPGLRAFEESEARFFFGRQTEITEALQLIGGSTLNKYLYRRWLLIEGPSGAGKSSLVKAGLLPSIRHGALYSGGDEKGEGRFRDWRICEMRPGVKPLESLAKALIQLQKGQGAVTLDTPTLLKRLQAEEEGPILGWLLDEILPQRTGLLLYIDQLEELFTLTDDPAVRAAFDRLLAGALQQQDGPLHLITTIRSDFMLRFDDLPMLKEGINESVGRYYLKTMGEAGLKDVVHTPPASPGCAGANRGSPTASSRTP